VESRELIADVWFRRVLRTYPPQGAEFLATEPDPFRNPTGHTIRAALRTLLDELCLGMDRGRVGAALDSLIQIRAVESVAPSRALEFLFQLKDILRIELSGADRDLLNGRIDEMALIAFDLYMKYRERACEARMNEARRRELSAWQERGGR
jgi:hypothetical protein